MARNLLKPIKIGDLQLKNRVFMAPLTRNRADIDLVPTEQMLQYYTQRSSAGLIIAEATQPMQSAQGYPLTPGVYTAEQVAGWRKITDSVHAHGGHMFLQLWHCGRVAHSSFLGGKLPISASTVKITKGQQPTMSGMQDYETPTAATLEEIQEVVKGFKHGAANALKAGFDGVEIHAANGYLIDQFLRDHTNKRTDAYGGSIENRFRFLKEILEAVLEVVPANRLGVRLTPGGTFSDMLDSNSLEHFTYIVKQLDTYNLAYLHIKESDAQDVRHGGEIIPVDTFRPHFKGPILTNTNYTLESGEEAIASGKADAVTYGRPFITNPDLPIRFELGAKVRTDYDYSSFFGGTEKGYTDYKSLAEEEAETATVGEKQ